MPTQKTKKPAQSKAAPQGCCFQASSLPHRENPNQTKKVVTKELLPRPKPLDQNERKTTKASTTKTKTTYRGHKRFGKGCKGKDCLQKNLKNDSNGSVFRKEAAKSLNKNIEPHALNDEMNEKVRELIHLSREQGFLTYKDVDKALPEIATQPEELQNVISIFNNLEIKLLDSADVDKFRKKKEEIEE